MVRTLCALGIVFTSVLSSCPASSETTSDPLLETVRVSTIEAAPEPAAAPALAEPTSTVASEIPVEVDIYKAVLYTLRRTPPDELIRIAWDGTGQVDRALSIARRESGLRCDADNPRSSASGLFQHLSIHRARAERLGLSWSNVAGPDCLDDVILARAMYAESGWRPWRV